MFNDFKVIDADGHVMEPPDMWREYVAPEFRDRAPRRREIVVSTDALADCLSEAELASARDGRLTVYGPLEIDGQELQHKLSAELMIRTDAAIMESFGDSAAKGFSAASHVEFLRRTGIDMVFLYPTYGLWLFAIDSLDPGLTGALVRAYNDWLFDFCRHDASLRGVGAINRHDPEEMVTELRRVAGFGWRAVFLRPNPIKGRLLSDPAYEPFWSECERLGVAVGIHEASLSRVPTVGAERFGTHFALHACSQVEHMMAFLTLVEGGVLERHPDLQVAFLEAGCGWVPYWLWRLDQEYKNSHFEVKKNVTRRPSEYFRRQCFVGCEPSEPYLAQVIDFIGEDRLLFGSDYPHFDHDDAALEEVVRSNTGISRPVMQKILWDNPARFYRVSR